MPTVLLIVSGSDFSSSKIELRIVAFVDLLPPKVTSEPRSRRKQAIPSLDSRRVIKVRAGHNQIPVIMPFKKRA
jgi:hypothetical protein